jgi:lactoylglutathione lyase
MKGQAMKKMISSALNIAATLLLIMSLGGCVVVDKRDDGSAKDEGETSMYKKLTTNMMVENVDQTIDFYSDVLGFEFVMGVPENSQDTVFKRQEGQALDFAMVHCGNVEMMLQAKTSMFDEIPGFSNTNIGASLTFYIEVDNVSELYERLRDKVEIIREMQTTFYGMCEFYIRDCNGYILTFAGKV